MAINTSHRCIKAWIRDAPDTNAAIVVGYVLNQPVNGVVGVGGFVALFTCLVGNVRTHIFEFALALIATAHIAVDEDVAFAGKELIRTERGLEFIRPIR